MEKTCMNCKHSNLSIYDEPCHSCAGKSDWEPQEPQKNTVFLLKSKVYPYETVARIELLGDFDIVRDEEDNDA